MEGKKQSVMKMIAPYAGGHVRFIAVGRCLAGLSALVAMAPFYDLWRIVRVAAAGENLSEIGSLGWKTVGLTIAAMVMYIGALICTHIAAFRVQANMRSMLMHHIMKLPLGTFDKEGTGKILRIVNESTAATESFIAHSLPDKAVAAVTPIGLIALFLLFDWKLGLICFIPAVIGVAFMMGMMGKEMQEKTAEYQNALDNMSAEAVEYVRGIPVVKTFGQTMDSFQRFRKSIDDYCKWTTDYTVMVRKPMIGFMTSINSIFAVIIGAAYLFGHGGVTPELLSNVMYYILVTPLLTVTLTKIAYSGEAEMMLTDAVGRIEEILNIEPLADAGESGNIRKGTDSAAQDYSVEFSHVSYRYPDADREAVSDLSIHIGSGEKAAFIGPSGGGKTTAAELIARFFDVTEGSVRIGGRDVRDIPQDELMGLVSFVFQDNHLLKTSILENVRMARPEATEAEVMAALETAQCGDIIEKLPDGINTVLGTKGTYLSGGEQQRIAIARSILADAPILILDEATAFADPENEEKVQAAFSAMSGDKTVIMIAHRLSTVVDSDVIFVMNEGHLAESGNHEELMEKDGMYRRMYDEYNRMVEWKEGA